MNRNLILSLLLFATSMVAKGQSISYIEQTNSWVYVYDEANKKVCTKYAGNIGEVVGWGCDYWISRFGDWYYIWTAKGVKYKTLYVPYIGDIVAVNANTFVSRLGNWLYTFDKNGKKIATKYAPK